MAARTLIKVMDAQHFDVQHMGVSESSLTRSSVADRMTISIAMISSRRYRKYQCFRYDHAFS